MHAHEVSIGKRAPMIGELLVSSGVVTRQQLESTLRQQRQLATQGRSVRLGDLLVRNRFTTSAAIEAAMHSGSAAPIAQAREQILSPAACAQHRVIPVSISNGTLTIKTARRLRPHESNAILAAASVKAERLKVLCADAHEMHAFLATQMAHDSFASTLDRLRVSDHNASLVKMAIEALMHEAIDMRVSDIHMDLKPEPDAWISLRVDGDMQPSHLLSYRLMAALCSRIKTLAGMDASNSRNAQDGRLEIDHRGRMVGFRVATQPLIDGETLTIRIIDAAALPTAEALFPHQPDMMQLLSSTSNVHGKSGGMVLVTGPTGSGKSVTLYTMASGVDRDRANVITVENPVEFKLPFARQIQIQDLLGQKATDVERSILRQDPDILIFGEIRDSESCEAALKFGESGHFVMSTLHAQSAFAAVERLLFMLPEGERSEASLVLAAILKAIINQRLFRRLCDCSTGYSDEEFSVLAGSRELERVLEAKVPRTAMKPVGCHRCNHTGYKGRVAVHETLIFAGNEKHRDSLAKALLNRTPLKSLLDDGAVRLIARRDTVLTLLEVGLMDVATASLALNVHEVADDHELALVEDVK